MPYLFDICHHRFNVLTQLLKKRACDTSFAGCLHVAAGRVAQVSGALIQQAFFTPRTPVQRSSLLSPSEAPLRSSNKIGLRAVSSSRGERLIACKTFMSCGYWRTLTCRFRLRVHLLFSPRVTISRVYQLCAAYLQAVPLTSASIHTALAFLHAMR